MAKSRFIMRLWLVFSCASFLMSACTSQPSLKLGVTLNKDIYKIGDRIVATLLLENLQLESVIINTEADFTFLVTLSSGRRAFEDKWGWDDLSREKAKFVELLPGRVMAFQWPSNIYSAFTADEAGAYVLQVIYHNRLDPLDGKVAWRGDIRSAPVKFTIEP